MDLIALRHELHKNPELSGRESGTAGRIISALGNFHPDNLLTDVGGTGIIATWDSGKEGPHVLFRAELDALPIQDTGTSEYRSSKEGVGHLCGHDGHMSILIGLAERIAAKPPASGKVSLLFQPAEETGAGAAMVIQDPKFKQVKPDYVYALHNLPGFWRGNIVLRVGPFACASRGLIIRLHGKTAHAAHPEEAVSPALAISSLIRTMIDLPVRTEGLRDFVLATVIHARLGEVAFGTTPGEGVVMVTLRSALDGDMEILSENALEQVDRIAAKYSLRHETEWVEEFPATVNHPDAASALRASLNAAGLEIEAIDKPFRWSEDVGHFSKVARLTLFGLGSGLDHSPLHAPDYDFPDELLPVGVKAFEAVLRSHLG